MNLVISNLLVLGLLILFIGYFLPAIKDKRTSITIGWLLTGVTLVCTVEIVAEEPALIRMFALVSLLMLAMKMLVVNETYAFIRLNFVQWSAFALGWFGMRPVLFERLNSKPLSDNRIFIKGVGAVCLGVVFLWTSKVLEFNFPTLPTLSDLSILLGISLILHFGILNFTTSFWRALGVDVTELFKSPYKAQSLNEFWSKRWNVAFSEMTAVLIYRPFKSKLGKTASLFLAFIFSGVLHEIAISVPVKAGYGLPLLYFLLHAIAMYAENNSRLVKSILTNRIVSHVWVVSWIIIPLPILFHHSFINEVLIL